MKPRLCFLTLILVTIVFSISYAQNDLYNKKIKQLSLNQIEKGIPEKKENRVAQYFKGIARDVFNDGIHSVTHIPGTFKNMFTIPFRRENRIYTGISLGFLGSCFIFDQNLYDLGKNQSWWPYKRKWHPGEPAKLPVFLPIYSNLEWFESHLIAFAEYGYGVGLLIRNDRLRTLCFNLMQATAYSFVLTRGMKSLCGRARPNVGGSMEW